MRATTKSKVVRILLSIALASAALAGVACNPKAARSDADINGEIQAKVAGDPAVQNRQIAVETAHGVATLSGTVASEAERRVAADDAASVAGVRTVVNNLTVAPASPEPQSSASQAPAPVAPPPPAATRARSRREREREARLAARKRQREEAEARARWQRQQSSAARPSYARASTPAAYSEPVRQEAPAPPPPAYSQPAYPQSAEAQPAYAPPAPAAAPPPSVFVTIPAGTPLTVRLQEPLDSATATPGQTFRATLSEPVWMNGSVVIPSEAEVEGRVTDARSAGKISGAAVLSIELMRVGYNGRSYVIHTDQWSREIQGRGKNSAEKVGGGAAVGAIIGALAGGGKGAGIGALIGGGAGGTAQAVTHAKQVVLDTEARISFRLADSATVRPAAVNERNVGRQPLN